MVNLFGYFFPTRNVIETDQIAVSRINDDEYDHHRVAGWPNGKLFRSSLSSSGYC